MSFQSEVCLIHTIEPLNLYWKTNMMVNWCQFYSFQPGFAVLTKPTWNLFLGSNIIHSLPKKKLKKTTKKHCSQGRKWLCVFNLDQPQPRHVVMSISRTFTKIRGRIVILAVKTNVVQPLCFCLHRFYPDVWNTIFLVFTLSKGPFLELKETTSEIFSLSAPLEGQVVVTKSDLIITWRHGTSLDLWCFFYIFCWSPKEKSLT